MISDQAKAKLRGFIEAGVLPGQKDLGEEGKALAKPEALDEHIGERDIANELKIADRFIPAAAENLSDMPTSEIISAMQVLNDIIENSKDEGQKASLSQTVKKYSAELAKRSEASTVEAARPLDLLEGFKYNSSMTVDDLYDATHRGWENVATDLGSDSITDDSVQDWAGDRLTDCNVPHNIIEQVLKMCAEGKARYSKKTKAANEAPYQTDDHMKSTWQDLNKMSLMGLKGMARKARLSEFNDLKSKEDFVEALMLAQFGDKWDDARDKMLRQGVFAVTARVQVTEQDIQEELKHLKDILPPDVGDPNAISAARCKMPGPTPDRPPVFMKKTGSAMSLWKSTLEKYRESICGQSNVGRQWAAAVAIFKARAKKHHVNIGISVTGKTTIEGHILPPKSQREYYKLNMHAPTWLHKLLKEIDLNPERLVKIHDAGDWVLVTDDRNGSRKSIEKVNLVKIKAEVETTAHCGHCGEESEDESSGGVMSDIDIMIEEQDGEMTTKQPRVKEESKLAADSIRKSKGMFFTFKGKANADSFEEQLRKIVHDPSKVIRLDDKVIGIGEALMKTTSSMDRDQAEDLVQQALASVEVKAAPLGYDDELQRAIGVISNETADKILTNETIKKMFKDKEIDPEDIEQLRPSLYTNIRSLIEDLVLWV